MLLEENISLKKYEIERLNQNKEEIIELAKLLFINSGLICFKSRVVESLKDSILFHAILEDITQENKD